MEKQQYILNLSLKQMALRKVAIVLWNQEDNLHLVTWFDYCSLDEDGIIKQWNKTVEKIVFEKMPRIPLPDVLKEELKHVTKPIGTEILKWRMYHESLTSERNFAFNNLHRLCWTSVGTVDYRKTAKMLIRLERIDIISSYKLACTFCFDEDIRIIWGKLSDVRKKLFYNEVSPLLISQPDLVIFWTCLIRGEEAKLDDLINRNTNERGSTCYQYAFECAALSGNITATEYFFRKLTSGERDASLVETAERVTDKRCSVMRFVGYNFSKENFCDVLCYLLSEMREEEQIQVIKRDPYKTLRCFMDWPWQDLFMKITKLMWSFFHVDDYYSIMQILAQNRSLTGCNYPKLFGELFLEAPSHYRSYMVYQHREFGFWFRDLLYANNAETIKLVLRNVDDKDRDGFILCEKGIELCWTLIDEGKWFLLELFVSECRLSSEAKTVLKSSFMNFITRVYNEGQIKRRSRLWERFFQLIDNANVNDDNKKIIEDAEKEEELKGDNSQRKRRKKYSMLKK